MLIWCEAESSRWTVPGTRKQALDKPRLQLWGRFCRAWPCWARGGLSLAGTKPARLRFPGWGQQAGPHPPSAGSSRRPLCRPLGWPWAGHVLSTSGVAQNKAWRAPDTGRFHTSSLLRPPSLLPARCPPGLLLHCDRRGWRGPS